MYVSLCMHGCSLVGVLIFCIISLPQYKEMCYIPAMDICIFILLSAVPLHVVLGERLSLYPLGYHITMGVSVIMYLSA